MQEGKVTVTGGNSTTDSLVILIIKIIIRIKNQGYRDG
jgi:hypothetical protein